MVLRGTAAITKTRLTVLDAGSAGKQVLSSGLVLSERLRGFGETNQIDAVYVHVPFCRTKCHYCDFYSVAGHLDQADAYLEALAREVSLQVSFFGRAHPRTMFIGGGTPTLLSPDQLDRLLATINKSLDCTALEEFTVEANPNCFDADHAAVLATYGVNRISFGAQSFIAAELKMLQRDHDPENVSRAFELARRAGIRDLNLDLIFGIPGQTLETWEFSLARALELAATHMSCYSLTYEPNTAMTARLRRGEFTAIDEELELAMFQHVYQRLHKAGFIRYEVSNYGRRISGGDSRGTGGAQDCRHNLIYWKAGNWLGLGPGAGAHLALPKPIDSADSDVAWQWKNVGSLAHYLDALSGKQPRLPLTQMEALSRTKWAGAAAVFWLRLAEGLEFREFEARVGLDAEPILQRVLSPFVGQGLVEITPERARILEPGVAVSNHILSRVLKAFETAQRPNVSHA